VTHSPLVVLVGGLALDHYGKDAFQEYDLVGMFRPVTKLALQITKAERIPELLHAAFRAALGGRPGPVFVEISREVLADRLAEVAAPAPARYRATHPQPPHPEAIREAADLLRRAQRPLLLVGGGVSRAGANDVVVELSERHGIPMITAYGRNDAVPNGHPLYIGPLGRAGAPEAAAACKRADVVLAAGTRLGQFTTHFDDRYLKPETAIIQIDIEGRDLGRHYPLAVGIHADAREACVALRDALARDGGAADAREAWRKEAETLRALRRARLAAEADLDTKPMKPQRVYAELRRALPPDTIVALDAGAAPAYGYDRLEFAGPATFLTPLDLGGLGFAFPEALGAKLGRPERPVLAVHGDGGFLMNAQELETAVRHGIGVVTLVMNNNCWGSEKAYQKHFYGERYIGCDIGNPRYDQFARLFGAEGYYVDRPEDVGAAVRAALGAGKPAVIEIPIDPNEFPTPVAAVRRAP
jgi:acetolactate synthase-1/2/3 large subunit/sulfoacetaldehyde acetyltransferase